MAAFDLAPALRAAMLVGGVQARLDAGSAACYVQLFGGARPGSPGGSTAEDVLASVVFSQPATELVGDQLVFSPASDSGALVLVTGSATWARLFDGDDIWLGDCDVTDSAGAGPLRVSGTTGTMLYAGARVLLDELTMG